MEKDKQPKVLVATITSDMNSFCQNKWLGKILFLDGYYDMIIFENSDTKENYERMKFFTHNYSNIMIKRGTMGFDSMIEKICANRNLVLDYVREHKEYDYVLMVDSDVFPPNNVFTEFLKRDYDIQCGFCLVNSGGLVIRPACNFFKDDIKNGNAQKWVDGRFINNKPRMVKIAQNGMGCVFIKADILRKHKDLNFYNKEAKKGEKTKMNEDLTFTGNLQKMGYDLWLDLKMECIHEMKS